MKVLRYSNLTYNDLNSQLPPDKNITVMHLGRGGVLPNCMLDDYNQKRVLRTLGVALNVQAARRHAEIQILWTGGHNRQLDRAGTELPAEAKAARRYARTKIDDRFTQLTEENSTSTVENATRSVELIPEDHVIVVVTDKLHYLTWKVQFIFWLVFPSQKVVFIKLSDSPPGTTWKNVAIHLVSTVVTVVGMAGVPRGNAAKVRDRQKLLERLTGH